MPSNQFNQSPRGDTVCTLTVAQLYEIVRKRASYLLPDHDPDAVAQNFCVEVEKKMGIFPNVPGLRGGSDAQR